MVGRHLLLPVIVTMVTKAVILATTFGLLNLKVVADTTSPHEGADILSLVLPILTSKDVEVDTPYTVHTHTQHSQQTTSEDSNSIVGGSTEDSNETESR